MQDTDSLWSICVTDCSSSDVHSSRCFGLPAYRANILPVKQPWPPRSTTPPQKKRNQSYTDHHSYILSYRKQGTLFQCSVCWIHRENSTISDIKGLCTNRSAQPNIITTPLKLWIIQTHIKHDRKTSISRSCKQTQYKFLHKRQENRNSLR